MSQPSGSRFAFTAPFDLYAELQRLDRIAGAIGASTEIASSYDEAARELVSKLRGAVTEGQYPVGGWIAADDLNRLVREIDVAINGVDAAPQAKLCDIAAQVKKAAREFGPILGAIGAPPKPAGAHSDDWAIAAAFREVTGPNGGLIKNDEVVDFISTRAREMIANARPIGAVPLPNVYAYAELCATDDPDVFVEKLRAWMKGLPVPEGDNIMLLCHLDAAIAYGNAREASVRAACSVPEGWKITRNEVGGIYVEGPEGWMSMPDTTPKNGNFSLEMRLLYGLAEAMLSASLPAAAETSTAPSAARPHAVRCGMDLKPCHCDSGTDHVAGAEVYFGQDQPTAEPKEHAERRLRQLIGKASFSNGIDKHEALELLMRMASRQVATGITAEWVKGYLASDTAPENLQAIDDAFGEWRALHPTTPPDAELIKRFRIAARALIGIRQPPVPEGQQRPVYAEDVETMADVLRVLECLAQQPPVSDTTAALIDMLRQREATGLIKYGKTLDRTDLSQAEWLQHMAEEMLDGAGYALAALRTMKAELYEDTDGDLYLDLGGRGTNGERFMRRYANDDRDWVSAGEFALLTPFNPSTPQQNEQEKP